MLSLMTAALGATSCFEGEEGWVAAAQAAAVKRLATLRPEDFDGPLSA